MKKNKKLSASLPTANTLERAFEHHQNGQLLQAQSLYQQILKSDPQNIDALHFSGVLAAQMGKYELAVILLKQALSLSETTAVSIQINLANALLALKQTDEAEMYYRQAIALEPDFAPPYYNLSNLLRSQGKLQEAIVSCQEAIRLEPHYISALFNLGLFLLSAGRYEEGWQYNEYRYHPDSENCDIFPPPVNFPAWQGESLQQKTIVIWQEQGFGDEIQFCRYAFVLKQLGAKQVTLVCKCSLKSLFQRLPGVDSVLTTDEAITITHHDYWVFMQSLPLHCKTILTTIPATIPYLTANQTLVKTIAKNLKNISEFKVGICWQGYSKHTNDANRSPRIGHFNPLFQLSNVKFFTLQPQMRFELLHTARKNAFDFGREIDISSFEEAAALIMNLDLIISCDTSICHLAGALGKQVWIVLPFVADWRWLVDREDSPWYPTAKLFRQQQAGNWTEVFERVEAELKIVVAKKTNRISWFNRMGKKLKYILK